MTAAAAETTYVPLTELFLASEAPEGVDLVVRNSSSGSPLTDAELKASLYTNGVLNPLFFKVVQGKRYVIAGNRRLRLLREIFAGAEHSQLAQRIKVQDVDTIEGDWRQIAIDTNLSLPPHIVERYEQIALLAKDLKLSPEDVQSRFGMTPRQYNQVMALGRMSPTIRELWKNGEIDAKTAQAFTLEPDPKEQDKMYAAAKKRQPTWMRDRGEPIRASDIREQILPANQREVGKLVAFLGVSAVRKEKLLKTEDLFSTSHTVTDAKKLKKLADAKLAQECEFLVQSGWAWAVREDEAPAPTHHYGTIEPAKKTAPTETEAKEMQRLERLSNSDDDEAEDADEQLTKMREAIKSNGYSDDQRRRSGCFVSIAGDGSLAISYGRIKPEERKKVQAVERATTKAKAKPKKPGEVQLTNALAERLSQQLEKAVKASMQATPHVAVCALIAAFASNGHVLDVAIGNESRHSYGKSSSAKNFVQIFEGAMKATPEARVAMLCQVAANALSIQISSATAKAPIEDIGLQALVSEMDMKFLNNAIKVEFDAKDYFDSVNLQACVDAVRDACGDGAAAEVAKMKKGAAAKFAAEHVVKENWLPKELRTCHYRGPKDKPKPAPAKKAPAKKAAKKKKGK